MSHPENRQRDFRRFSARFAALSAHHIEQRPPDGLQRVLEGGSARVVLRQARQNLPAILIEEQKILHELGEDRGRHEGRLQNGVDERERAGRQRFRRFVGEHEENAAIAAVQRVGLLQARHQQRNERLPTADNGNSESVLLDQDGNAAHEERSERLGDFGREMNDGVEEREEFVDGRDDVVVDAGVDEVENALDDGFELEIEERAGLNRAGEEREDVVLEDVDAFDVGFEQRGEEFDHEHASVHAGSGGDEMLSLEFALF